MFLSFTTPEGLPMHIRANRIQAVTRTDEGTTRIFLGGALSCLVAESDDEVLQALARQERPSEER